MGNKKHGAQWHVSTTPAGLLPAGAGKGTRALRHVFGPVVLVGSLIAAIILGVWFSHPEPRVVSDGIPFQVGADPVPALQVLDHEVEGYKENLNKLYANIGLQALLVGIAILLVIRRSDFLKLFDNSIPLSWLHFFLPVLMIYVWLGFGFILHDLIEGRVRGVRVIEAIVASNSSYAPIVDFEKARFHDGGFVDGWFIAFVGKEFTGIRPSFTGSTAAFLIVVFGTLISASNASILAIASIGCRRYLDERRQLFWYYWAPILPLALLLTSHLQFAYGGDNRNQMQVYVAMVTVPIIMVLLWLSAVVDKTSYPGSVQSLRRHHELTYSLATQQQPLTLGSQTTGESEQRIISLIGDSLSTSFYVSSLPSMLVRTWRSWRVNWFLTLGTLPHQNPSIVERLSAFGPITGVHHASPSAAVDKGVGRSLIDRLTDTWHFSHQVEEVLAGKFPDLLLIWIGHNDVDWKLRLLPDSEESLNDLSETFIHHYEVQLRRLINAALASKKKVALIVFGLVNFEAFFRARDEAEESKCSGKGLFPHLETGYNYFVSMRPENRKGMIELACLYNQKLEGLCQTLNQQLSASKLRLVYSGALSLAKIDSAHFLSSIDAWHPSDSGQSILAETAYPVVDAQAAWLGWKQAAQNIAESAAGGTF